MTHYTGLDVSLRFVSICGVDDKGEVRLEAKVKLDSAVKALVRADRVCRRLMSIPGVGPITAWTRNAQWSTLRAWGVRLAKTRGH